MRPTTTHFSSNPFSLYRFLFLCLFPRVASPREKRILLAFACFIQLRTGFWLMGLEQVGGGGGGGIMSGAEGLTPRFYIVRKCHLPVVSPMSGNVTCELPYLPKFQPSPSSRVLPRVCNQTGTAKVRKVTHGLAFLGLYVTLPIRSASP